MNNFLAKLIFQCLHLRLLRQPLLKGRKEKGAEINEVPKGIVGICWDTRTSYTEPQIAM